MKCRWGGEGLVSPLIRESYQDRYLAPAPIKDRLLLKSIMIALLSVALLTNVSVAEQCGGASWYGPGFNGKRSASGQIFNENAMTAAHRSLPFGTKVHVVDQRTGRTVDVVINDRGPFHRDRIIDLSKAAALELGIKRAGTGRICLTFR